MYLPWMRYSARIPEYEQASFRGIDRNKASSDGSIYDMRNISTDDFPLLSAVPNRKTMDKMHDIIWYYGATEKEYVIADKELGESYPLWEGETAYSIGDIVAYDGSLYIAVGIVNDDNTIPPSTSENFDLYTETTFAYDGVWSENANCEVNSVWYYNGNFYRNLTGESKNLEKDDNWEETDIPNYKGVYKHSYNYYSGDIVMYSGKFYEHLEYGNDTDGHYPSNETYWKPSDISVWMPDTEYGINAIVYDVQSEKFYKHLNAGKTIAPDVDTANWEPYSFSKLYYNNEEVIGLELMPNKKECAYLNGYIVILPDNMFYRVDDGTFGYLAGTKSGSVDTSKYRGIYYNSKNYDYPMKAGIVKDTSMNKLKLGFFGGNLLMDIDEYSNVDLTKIFRDGDVINVTQKRQKAHDEYAIIRNGSYVVETVEPSMLTFVTGTFSGADIGDDALIGGNDGYYYLGDVILSKGLPEMEFLCVANNRMWGCKEDTVYSSALGDVFSWQRYSGLETDPVYLEVGDIGKFTGCCEYSGYPTFFRENEIYRVYGSTASTFALQKVAEYGLRKDSPHGWCVVDSVLYFLSPQGMCAYAGGVPGVISDDLQRELSEGVAGTDGKKVYLSVNEGDGRILYVYDTQNRVWSSETLTEQPLGIINFNGELRLMDSEGNLLSLSKTTSEWQNEADTEMAYIEFNDFYNDSLDSKHLGGVIIRASVDPEYDALEIYVQYDSDGEWHNVGSIYNQDNRKKVSDFRFFPRKCDHYRLRLECRGKFTIHLLARQVEG